MRRALTLPLAAAVVLSGCTAVPKAAPPAPPVPVPAPVPPPAPALGADWRDWPVTPGNWSYTPAAGGGLASYGNPGAPSEFAIRCDRTSGQVMLSRIGAGAGEAPMTITTSSATRQLAARPTASTPTYLAATLGARDALIDAMGFSRGRFVVRVGALAPLVLPAWPEVLRVAEDCR
jgi:hypothetical protein